MESPLHMTQALRRMPPSPAAINQLLLCESENPPFYPAAPEWAAFFLAEKTGCTALDAKLQQAGMLSADARRKALAAGRQADRQGVFTTIILPNAARPGETLIIKIRRHASVGPGFGTFGGIVEPNETSDTVADLLLPLMREVGEEAREVLQDDAARLVAVLGRSMTIPLFKCRDDTHKINRGWGWCVDANAFATIVTNPDDQKELIAMLERLDATPNKHLAPKPMGVAETDGIAVFSLDQAPTALASLIGEPHAPNKTASHHYGHEALGEICGLEKAFQVLGIEYPVRRHYLATPGILAFIAPRMGIPRTAVVRLLDAVCKAPTGLQVAVPDMVYRNGQATRPAPAGATPTAPTCDS